MQMPQAAKRVWAEETEEQQVVARRHNRRRPALAARAQVNTDYRYGDVDTERGKRDAGL